MSFAVFKTRPLPSAGALILVVALALYSFLPIVGVKPVAIEGFEAAVSTGVNNVVLWGKSGASLYNFNNRPGEFIFYEAIQSLAPVDALWIGGLCSTLAYVASIVGVVLLARRLGFSSVVGVLIAFFLSFDISAAAAQASSSNIAAGLFILGCAFLTFSSPAVQLLGLLTCAGGIFARLDVVFLIPVVLMLALVRFQRIRPALLYGLLWSAAIYLFATLMYRSVGVHLISTLRGSGSDLSFFTAGAMKVIFVSLFPFALPLSLVGAGIDARRHWKAPAVAFGRAALSLGPMFVFCLIYSGRAASPRFLVPAYPFLALTGAVAVDAIAVGLSRLSQLKTLAILVLFVLALGLTWFARKPQYIWDGFRYSWASYATPAQIFKLKTYLLRSNALMAKQVFDPAAAAGGPVPTRDVMVTSWRRYNELAHAAALLGNGVEGGDSISLIPGRPAANCTLYMIRGVRYRICLAETGREYVGPDEARAFLSKYLEERPTGLIVADPDVQAVADDASLHLRSSLLSSYDDWNFHSVLMISKGG